MGRPALLGSHPRGPQYRGVQVPPHYGNRPRWRKERTTYLTQCKNPKSIVPALSRSEMTIQDRRYHSRHQRKSNQTIIQKTELRNITDTCTKQYITPERCPGGTTRRWLGSSPQRIWPEKFMFMVLLFSPLIFWSFFAQHSSNISLSCR